MFAQGDVVPGVDVLVAVGGTGDDRGLGGVVGVLDLFTLPHHLCTDTGLHAVGDLCLVIHVIVSHR
ncbi:hypothetical protein D3C80_1677290 [compost metagenome]